MWIVMMPASRPDASVWSGRRELAVVDAVAWPLFWVWLLRHVPAPVGLVGAVGNAIALLSAILRVQRAIWMNHRYWFTTWRWGKVAVAMMLMGWAMRLSLSA